MVEDCDRVAIRSWGMPPALGQAGTSPLLRARTPEDLATALAGMLPDVAAIFRAVLSLGERVARDPALAKMLTSFLPLPGSHLPVEGIFPAGIRPAMPVPYQRNLVSRTSPGPAPSLSPGSRKVDVRGRVTFEGQRYFVGADLAGEHVGVSGDKTIVTVTHARKGVTRTFPRASTGISHAGAVQSHHVLASPGSPELRAHAPPKAPLAGSFHRVRTNENGKFQFLGARYRTGRKHAWVYLLAREEGDNIATYTQDKQLIKTFPKKPPRQVSIGSGKKIASHARPANRPTKPAPPRVPYTFAQVERDHVQIYDAGLKPVAKKPLQVTPPVPVADLVSGLETFPPGDLAALPASSHGRPFQLLAFDLNHLHVRACRTFPDKPLRVVKQVQRVVLDGLSSSGEYFALYFASQNFARFQRDQPADARHGWYVEQGIKAWGEDGMPKYADVDVPLAHVVTQVLERYPGQVTRVVLGSGDKDHKTLCMAIKAAGIPLDIVAVAEEDVSRELRHLADRIIKLYG